MANENPIVALQVRPFALYSLRIFPLWEGDAERVELGSDLQAVIDRIVREKSVAGFLGSEAKPMRFCQLERQEAIYVVDLHKTYYENQPMPIWKVMVPAAGIYNRETIVSCMSRGTGRNLERYENVLFSHPEAVEFYTYSANEIRPVDDTVFVIGHSTR